MDYKDLSHEQARQIVDVEGVYETWRGADQEQRERFKGSMFWKQVDAEGREYLYREIKGVQQTLGPRSAETEAIYEAFKVGRNRNRDVLQATTAQLKRMAPVNKALGLGQMPTIAAKILRRLDAAGLLGKPLRVTGTHALYAFERACGVQIGNELLSTKDVDLLYDGRAKLKLAGDESVKADGIIGILRSIDRSFQQVKGSKYCARNKEGFMVDLIKPIPKDPMKENDRSSKIGIADDDLVAADIKGLQWLVNSPSFERIVIGMDGYPVRMVCPDPRAWAVHKLWVSDRKERDPIKRGRDRAQGLLVVDLLKERLPHLRFDSADLQALPLSLRNYVQKPVRSEEDEDGALQPDW